AVLVGHGLGVDESLVLDNLSVLTGEPHLHRAVWGAHLHRHKSGAADAHVHLGDGNGGAIGSVPRREVFGFGPHLPDHIHRGIEAALDHHRVLGTVVVSHRGRPPFVAVWSCAW